MSGVMQRPADWPYYMVTIHQMTCELNRYVEQGVIVTRKCVCVQTSSLLVYSLDLKAVPVSTPSLFWTPFGKCIKARGRNYRQWPQMYLTCCPQIEGPQTETKSSVFFQTSCQLFFPSHRLEFLFYSFLEFRNRKYMTHVLLWFHLWPLQTSLIDHNPHHLLLP